jgi:hypothetical protein
MKIEFLISAGDQTYEIHATLSASKDSREEASEERKDALERVSDEEYASISASL